MFRSTDAGRVFHPASIGVMLSNHAVFAAASAGVAVAGDFRLYRTANGGVSYAPVETDGALVVLSRLHEYDARRGAGENQPG